jgi:glyoxylase-like metal-dependent hydrolase (beta-lactamase superfamily II)
MEQLRPGLYTWTASHPEWKPGEGGPEGWEQEVRSYAYDGGDVLVLLDPQSPPARTEQLAAGKDVAVVLTCSWHGRSADDLVGRLAATVHFPEAEDGGPGATYRAGDTLPGGIEAKGALFPGEALLWIPEHGALVAGDLLINRPEGLRAPPDSWLPEGLTREALRESLQPLLELPVELVLPTHGDPVTDRARNALKEALGS